MQIIKLDQIEKIIDSIDILPLIEKGFVAYSNGLAVIPPVGELVFKDPPADVHLKYGYLMEDEIYVIKIASSFYENLKLNLPSSNGLMLIFSQKTGQLLSILLDEGYLTNLRTAAAGAIVAKYLAPKQITNIGIIGTGTQARLQLSFLKQVTDCRDVFVFGRNKHKVQDFKIEIERSGFNVTSTEAMEELTSVCNLIVTTTSSTTPLLFAKQLKKGTHITAVGADSHYKQEVDENIFKIADIIVADSISQCSSHGDTAHAIRKKIINQNQLIELGNIISGSTKGRTDQSQITIADLTGLAVQDIQIAKAVYQTVAGLREKSG